MEAKKKGFLRRILYILGSALVLLVVITASECPGAGTGGIGGGEGDGEPEITQRLYIGGTAQVLVVDPVAKEVITTISIPGAGQLGWLAMRPDMQKLYCSDTSNHEVLVIDTATNTHSNSINVNYSPRGIGFTVDSTKAAVGCYDGCRGIIDIIDATTETMEGVRTFGWPVSIAGLDVHMVNNKFYATDMNGCVWVGDVSPGSDGNSYRDDQNSGYDVELSPDGNKLYQSGNSPNASNYDLYVATIDGGGALTFDPFYARPGSAYSDNRVRVSYDNNILYFTNYSYSNVDAIDTSDPGAMVRIDLSGVSAHGTDVAFSLDSSTVYVLSEFNTKVVVIDTATKTVVDEFPLPGAVNPRSMVYAILP